MPIVVILFALSHDYSIKENDNVTVGFSDITRNLRNYRPTFELREQFLYNNQVWPSCPPVLAVTEDEM